MTCIAAGLIGEGAFPVRAVAFDKTPETNWSVAWHQDRTIAVESRVETEGFGPWSTKDGQLHVAPPVEVLQGMATLRLHIDDCDDGNAPLKAALGTHRLGMVPADKAAEVAAAHLLQVCHAEAGDVWAYATLILHASERSRSAGRRRVLQVDYAAVPLPGELKWVGLTRFTPGGR
ncbi:MAG TPA: phytanoyl-CoA dioxygenase family protein [Asticcacaulis sp.]|nr:phytanoyl-CoA dioxygenase family protein [Asticcacaulis sp.]